MRTPISCWILVLASWCFNSATASAQNKPQQADFKRLAEIFSPAGSPDISGKQWVAIDTGPSNWKQELHGWLMADGKETIVVDWYGELHKLHKPQPKEQRPKLIADKEGSISFNEIQSADYSTAWGVRNEDISAKLKKFLADGLPKENEAMNAYSMAGARFGLADHVVDAARHAHHANVLGLKKEAAALAEHAVKAQQKHSSAYSGLEKPEPLHVFVAERMVSSLHHIAVCAAHGGRSRKELKANWDQIAAIPYHQHRDKAKQMAKHYQSLLDEDARWVEPDAKSIAKMTTEQKATYWMYRLRDLDVGQWSDPGSCYVLGGDFGFGRDDKKPNAAKELAKLDIAVIPALIEHMDDSRPTRCKEHWRSYWPEGHHLLSYGDCCQQIFESITGQTITGNRKANAETWWLNFQKKGEKQVYIEGTIKGDRDSAKQARRLAGKYPEDALDAIRKGARACSNEWTRADLVSTAADLKDSGVLDFMRSELTAPYLYPRVRAAAVLAARADPAGVKALQAEWKKLPKKPTDRSWAIDELVSALARSGNPEAIRSLGKEMGQHHVGVRETIVGCLESATKDLEGKPLRVDAVAAIEDVLIAAMADTEQTNSSSWRADGKQVDAPMLGDLAAEALASRWKQANLFDIVGPMQVRERQRLAVKNVWLQKRGKEPVAIPAARHIASAPDATMQPLIKELGTAKSPGERKTVLKSIDAVGLPGLPALKKYLAGLKTDDPAYADVKLATTRLALTVAEIRFGSDSAKPTDAVRRTLEGRKGKPITEAAFMNLLREIAQDLPAGSRGVKITMERIPDDTGVLLELTLIPERPAREGLSPQLAYGSRIIAGKQHFGGGIGLLAGLGRDAGLSEIDWSEFSKNLRAVLVDSADKYLFVQAHCAHQR